MGEGFRVSGCFVFRVMVYKVSFTCGGPRSTTCAKSRDPLCLYVKLPESTSSAYRGGGTISNAMPLSSNM